MYQTIYLSLVSVREFILKMLRKDKADIKINTEGKVVKDKIMGKKIFKRKAGGTKVGNALRSVGRIFKRKPGGTKVGNVARSLNPFVKKTGGSKTGNALRAVASTAKKIVKKNPNKKSKPKKKTRWDGSFRKTL